MAGSRSGQVGRRESRAGVLAEVGQGCVVAGLVIGLAMVGGLAMRAVEDVRQVGWRGSCPVSVVS